MLVMMYENTFQVFVDQIFRIFDKDGNGSIDFKVVTICILVKIILIYWERQLAIMVLTMMTLITILELVTDDSHAINTVDTLKEFMMATDMTASGSPEEKLRWAFKMYDKDGSGGPVKKHFRSKVDLIS